MEAARVTSPSVGPTLIVAHTRQILPVTQVRSTIIQTSIRTLRARGHLERYRDRVPPQFRDDLLLALAPGWLPLRLAVVHYQACDELGLSTAEIGAIGESGADALQGIFLSTLVRSVRAMGVTPWTLLTRFDRLYGRLFQGGSVEVIRQGPAGAQLEWAGFDGLAHLNYFRSIVCGNVRAGLKFVGVTPARVELIHSPSRGRLTLSTSWS